MTANAEILWILVEHLALTAVPGVAAILFAMRRGVRGVPLLLALGLLASGAIAILSFWAYYASPTVGRIWAFLVVLGSIEIAVWSVYRGGLDRRALRELRVPLLLWILGSFFIVYLGFLHGGSDQAIPMSALRFTGQLPSDNDIPQFFASWFYENGHDGTPPLYPGEWHMSDRPPLQIGYVLSQRTFGWDTTTLHYQILCVVIQQLWIVAVWAVLCAARLRPSTRGLAMFAAMFSDIAIIHGFFVWPKLIAATFLLAAVALAISPEWTRWRGDPRIAALFAGLCALALLAHGSSVFGVIPLLIFAALRGMPSWRWLAVAIGVGVVFLGPWTAYQRYADPPGNRLLKWQLGGAMDVDQRGTVEAIVDGYQEVGIDGAVDAKLDNFGEITGLEHAPDHYRAAVDYLGDGNLREVSSELRGPRFFSLLQVLGILLVAPIAMLLARDRGRRQVAEWRFALFCFAFVVVGAVSWGLLLFGSPDAIAYLHVGSLALPLLGICGCVAGLRATFPRLAIGIVAVNALGVLALYTPSFTPVEGSVYSAGAAVMAAASFLGFSYVALGSPSDPGRPLLRLPAAVASRVRLGQG